MVCIAAIGITGFTTGLSVGLTSDKAGKVCRFNSPWTRVGSDITHLNKRSKASRKRFDEHEDRLVTRGFGSSASLSNNGARIAVSGTFAFDGVSVYEFEPTKSSWILLGGDIDLDGKAHITKKQDFEKGISAAILSGDGTRIAVGEPFHSSNDLKRRGQVRVYEYNSESWSQVGNEILGTRNREYAGNQQSVDLSDNGRIVIVGDLRHNQKTGRVKVFKDVEGNWTQMGKDISGEFSGDEFGQSISLSADGTVVAAGAWHYKNRTGNVRIFRYSDGSWTQIGESLVGGPGLCEFGYRLSISAAGNRIAVTSSSFVGNVRNCNEVGAFDPLTDNTDHWGEVKVFTYEEGEWMQLGQTFRGSKPGIEFGRGISLSGDGSTLAIGSPSYVDKDQVNEYKLSTNRVGLLQTYHYACNNWTQVGKALKNEQVETFLGYSVSLSYIGEIMAVGTPRDYIAVQSKSGIATVYETAPSFKKK